MFGLGGPEILVLLFMCGGPIVVVLVVLAVARKGNRTAALEDENRRLRDDLDRERGRR